MSRHSDWPERLAAVLEQWRWQTFIWGERDCAHFALACLQAVSARDWSVLVLPRYSSGRGARRALARLGVADVVALADLVLGPRCPAAGLGRGDLVALAGNGGAALGSALGVCVDDRVAAMATAGLTFRPRKEILTGWRV